MKKKLMIGLLSSALLVGGATAAFAATDNANLASIKELYQQMFSIQKQIIDKQVEAGAITQDQANAIKGAIDQRAKYNEQAIDNGQVLGPGFGGMGGGFCGGYGFNGGQTLTPEQQDALNKARQQRFEARNQAIQNGTFTPGGYGRIGGGMMGAYYTSQY